MSYDLEVALESENELTEACDHIKVVIKDLEDILIKAEEELQEKLNKLQSNLAEQGIIDILVKLIELIYYKTVPFPKRELAFVFKPKKKGGNITEGDDIEKIAMEYLDPILEKLLKVLHLLIKGN